MFFLRKKENKKMQTLRRYLESSRWARLDLCTFILHTNLRHIWSHLGWHFSKLKAQSSNVSFHWNVAKETFELGALSFRKWHPKWDWLYMRLFEEIKEIIVWRTKAIIVWKNKSNHCLTIRLSFNHRGSVTPHIHVDRRNPQPRGGLPSCIFRLKRRERREEEGLHTYY